MRLHTPITIGLLALPLSAVAATFTDVPVNHPHLEAIQYMRDQDIVQGYSDQSFRPNSTINRAEFMKIMISATTDQPRGSDCFTDVKQEWFSSYICSAKTQGIIAGYPDGTFRPSQSITFVEAAKIISNAMRLQLSSETDPWYKPFVLSLDEQKAIPTQIPSLTHAITRGEMSEIIYRLKTANKMKESLTYAKLSGKSGTPHSFSSSSAAQSSSTATANTFPAALKITPNWFNEWKLIPIEGTDKTYSTAEVKTDSTEPSYFRIHLPKGSGNRAHFLDYNTPYGGVLTWVDPKIIPVSNIYFQYYVRFPEDFDFHEGGYLPGILTGITNNRKQESAASVELVWDKGGKLFIIGGFMQDEEGAMNEVETNATLTADGKWHRIDVHAQMQTGPGKDNGIIEAWIDGLKIAESKQVSFQNRAGELWDGMIFGVSMGKSSLDSVSPKDQFIDLRNFSFGNKPLAKDLETWPLR